MNRARAMMDALMGPGRDEVVTDKKKSKEKFKEPGVCKAFLVGLCPWDASNLGGKRNFAVCDKIHSEIMKQQYADFAEKDQLGPEYEAACFPELDKAVQALEGRIAQEKARIRDDWGKKRPPLPASVFDWLSQMKRESTRLVETAEQLDDDQFAEKQRMIERSKEITAEWKELEEKELKKAIANAIPEEVCEICGTCYQGDSGNAAHKQFKIHEAYQRIHDFHSELKPKVEEYLKLQKEKKQEERTKQRKEQWDKAAKEEPKGDRSRSRGKDRDRRRDSNQGDDTGRRGGRDRGRDDRDRDDGRGRGRDRGRDSRERDVGGGRGRDRGGGRRGGSRSRSRRNRR